MDRGAGDAGSTSLAARGQPATAGGAVLRAGGGFIGNTSITLFGLGAGAVLSMVNEVLAARFLGVAAYGLYALAMMAARVGEKIAVFGVPVSVLHYLPVHLNRDERQLALGAVVGGIPMSLGLGLALAFGLWIGADWIAAHVLGQPDAAYFIAVLGFAIPLMALIDLLGEITRGFGRALPYVVLRNLAPQLCTMAILIWLWRSHGPWSGVAYAQLGGLSIGVAVGIGFVLQMVRTRIGPLWPIMQLRRLYGYAVPIVGNTMVSLAMVWTDLFLLGILTDASAVGTYRGCMQITLLFDLIWNAFSSATATLYTVLIADGRREQLQETYTAAGRLAALVATPLLLVIMVNGGDILGLLGPAFAVGALPLFILACGQFVKLSFGAASIVLNVGGRQGLEAGNVALAAGLNLILNLLLIPIFGLLGAALATSTSLVGLALLRCVQIRRTFGLYPFDFALLRILLLTVPPALAVWAASVPLGLGPGSGPIALVLRLAVMGATIGSVLWFFGLKTEDRAMLLNLALRRGGRVETTGGAASPI